jgi:AcrR family transcriptional regulator
LAVGDALAERGFVHLDLADVARRADVGKTTVYRRWVSTGGLLADLLREMAESSAPRTDSGSLIGDLTANAHLVRRTLTDPRQGPLFRAVIVAAAGDTRVATALHHFYDIRVNEWAPCVQQAIDRQDVPANTATHEVIRAVSAAPVLPAADHRRPARPGRRRPRRPGGRRRRPGRRVRPRRALT